MYVIYGVGCSLRFILRLAVAAGPKLRGPGAIDDRMIGMIDIFLSHFMSVRKILFQFVLLLVVYPTSLLSTLS